jgi:uncharacterized protein YpmS
MLTFYIISSNYITFTSIQALAVVNFKTLGELEKLILPIGQINLNKDELNIKTLLN